MSEERLKEIIGLAKELDWVYPAPRWVKTDPHIDYPFMQISEVEKCMIAMYDDNYLERMKKWVEEKKVVSK